MLPTRRARLAIVVLGACVGVPIFLGGVLSGVPVLAVAAILGLGPEAHAVYSLAVLAALAGAAAVHGSRWYVVPAFTTFLVFLLLLYADPQDAGSRFGERVLETLRGVAIAYRFGLMLPALVR